MKNFVPRIPSLPRGKSLLRCLNILSQPLALHPIGYQLGLVLSEQTVRLCLVRRAWFTSSVVALQTTEVEIDLTEGYGPLIEKATAITVDFIRQHKLSRIPINIGLLIRGVGFRRIRLPEMPSGELSAAISWEGKKLFPFDFSNCEIHHEVVRKVSSGETPQLDVNIIAADKNIIEALNLGFKAAGLKIGQVNFLPCFLSDLLKKYQAENEDGHDLILYLDDEQSMAVFVHKGSPEFFQQFVTRPSGLTENESSLGNVESFGEELSSFLDLYYAQDASRSIDSIYLCGKFGFDESTGEHFARRTGLPCLTAAAEQSPLAGIAGLDRSRINSSIASVVTALSATYQYPLATRAFRTARARTAMIGRLGTTAALALLIAGSLQFKNNYNEHELIGLLQSHQAEISAFERSPAYIAYINLTHRLNRSKAYLNGIQHKRASHAHLLLKALSRRMPDQLNLTSLDVKIMEGRYVLQLDGHVKLKDFSPEIILAQYVEDLRKSPLFENISVITHQKSKRQGRFELSFQLLMDTQV